MIKNRELKQSPTFCMLPFMHIYGSAGGNIVPCCEAQEEALNNPVKVLSVHGTMKITVNFVVR